jgi:hypothetical protein
VWNKTVIYTPRRLWCHWYWNTHTHTHTSKTRYIHTHKRRCFPSYSKFYESHHGVVMVVARLILLLLLTSTSVCGNLFTRVFPALNFLKQNKNKDVIGAVNLRAGYPGQRKIWYYTGRMQDPLTGDTICGIEGVEMTRRLGSTGSTLSKSFLSRKAFIYTDSKNHTSPLKYHRLNQISPLRHVECRKIIDELVSFSTARDGQVSTQVEFPSGRHLTNDNLAITTTTKSWFPSHIKQYQINNQMSPRQVVLL